MHSDPRRLEAVWTALDGQRLPIDSSEVLVEVTEGVSLTLKFAVSESNAIDFNLALSGKRPFWGSSDTASPRFVIIPVGESVVLVGVAEPSPEPANLMPVSSTPMLKTKTGSVAVRNGFLSVARSDDTEVVVDFIPNVGEMDACVLRIKASNGDSITASHAPLAPSILQLAETAVKVSFG